MKTLYSSWARRQARDGTAVVETAVVFPLLLLMMFGIIQLGYFMYVRVMMMEAARRGCRAMVVCGKNSYSITLGTQTAQSYLTNTFPASQIFTYTPTPAPPTNDTTNPNYMIDQMVVATTIGQALQFRITNISDPPITAAYLMLHEGTAPIP